MATRHDTLVALLLVACTLPVKSTETSPCNSNGSEYEVEENSTLTIKCENVIGGGVTWTKHQRNTSLVKTDLGTCNPDCVTYFPDLVTLTLVGNASNLTILRADRDFFKYSIIICNDTVPRTLSDRCYIDIIRKPNVSCSLQLNNTKQPWTLDGSCAIADVYSSYGRYFYTVYRRKDDESETHEDLGLYAPEFTRDPLLGTGSCSYSIRMPTESGIYTYINEIDPGNVRQEVMTINIVRPSGPVAGCEGYTSYIPENTTATCTCNTSNIGEPGGQLVLRLGSRATVGRAGFTSLQSDVPLSLGRDDQSLLVSCNAMWTTTIYGSWFTLNPGYGPENTRLTLRTTNESKRLVLNEGDEVHFHCEAGGRPTPNVTLVNQDLKVDVANQLSPLNHPITATCEQAADYTCTARNGMGPEQGDSATLLVNCKPRSNEEYLPGVTLRNGQASFEFNLTSFPAPDRFELNLIGEEGMAGDEAKVKVDITNASCLQLGGRYRHISACTVVLFNVDTDKRSGMDAEYSLTLSNEIGSGTVKFQLINSDDSNGARQASLPAAVSAVLSMAVVVGFVLS